VLIAYLNIMWICLGILAWNPMGISRRDQGALATEVVVSVLYLLWVMREEIATDYGYGVAKT